MKPSLKSVPVYWTGTAPSVCDICQRPIATAFIDGRTKTGPWANMDPACHGRVGTGIGTGAGQRFEKQPDGRFLKVAG